MSPNGKLDPENIGIAVGILLISRLGAEILTLEVKRPPSWIFPLPVWSHSICISPNGVLDLKNVGSAVGISVVSCVLPCPEAEIHAFEVFGHHLGFFHFRLSHTVSVSISMDRWTQSLGNAVGLSLISCLWAEIQRLLSRFFGKFYNFRFCDRHIGILDDDGHARIVPSHSPDIFRRSYQKIFVYYMWFRNGSEKIGLWVVVSPLRLSFEG